MKNTRLTITNPTHEQVAAYAAAYTTPVRSNEHPVSITVYVDNTIEFAYC